MNGEDTGELVPFQLVESDIGPRIAQGQCFRRPDECP
jgi:hypothetical protein